MNRQSAAEIEIEAATWLIRLDREERPPLLMAELNTWLAGDTRRKGALLQMEAVWVLLDRLGDAQPETIVNDRCLSPAADGCATTAAPFITRRRLLSAVGTGSALAASLAAGVFWWGSGDKYQTATGEIRRVPLIDGSSVTINTASEVGVHIEKAQRRVRIVRGEAWFQVAKDPTRPFVVEAGRIRAEAVGTAFSVRRRDEGADVLVTEGIVKAWADGADGNMIRIAAGERAYIADNAAISHQQTGPSALDRTLAWRSGEIDLAGETLKDAVEEFNRYNERKLVIVDPSLESERFYGLFRIDDPEGFGAAMHQSLRASVETSENGDIRIGHTVS